MKHNLLNTIITIFLFITITIAVNFILSFSTFRKDCTEEKLYTLSNNTKEIIRNLKKKIIIRFYFSKTNTKIPLHYKNYAKRVSDLIDEYKIESNGNIIIERYNPTAGSNAENCALLDAMHAQPLNSGEVLYFGLSINSLDKSETFPFLTDKQENKLEYDLTRAILQLQNPKKKTIGILSSLPVMGESPTPELMKIKAYDKMQPWVVFRELKKDYKLKVYPFEVKEIDKDIDTLILVHPVGLTYDAQNAIDQYLLQGGKLLVFLDSYNIYFANKAKNNKGYESIVGSQFDKFLSSWGINFDKEKVVGDMKYARRFKTAEKSVTFTTALDLTEEAFNKDEIVLNQISAINYIFPGGFSYRNSKENDLKITPLITTSKESHLLNRSIANNANSAFASYAPDENSYDLAIKIEGKFKTAYPEGLPIVNIENRLTESKSASTIILVSDSDMLMNDICIKKERNQLGKEFYKPINDNIVLIQNLVEYLTGDKNLMGIRTRSSSTRPFKVLNDMKKDAEKELKEEITKLEDEVIKAQASLQNLQGLSDSSNGSIKNQAQKNELAKYKEKEKKVRKRLKKLTDKYQSSINGLITKLKWINICLIPLLVIIAGIIIAITRKAKQ